MEDDDATTALMLKHLNRLPKFSGKWNEDVTQWLKDMTDGLNYVKFTDDQKVSVISTYVSGDARKWLIDNVFILDSWSQFIQAINKMYAPTFQKDVTISSINQCEQAVDETMIYYDNDIMNEQKDELLKEEENSDYSTTISVELNNIVALNTCIMESGDNHFEIDWPDGGETWFIHDELPQRLHFIRCQQYEVSFSSTSNIDNDFAQEKLPDCVDVVSSNIIKSKNIASIDDVQVFDSLLKVHEFCAAFISFLMLLGGLAPILIIFRLIVTGGTTTSYFCRNVMSCDTKDRDWFRLLAVP